MTDIYAPKQRSRLMSRVRTLDTKPELAVRRVLHGLGFRYRLHRADLPGKPDIVLPGRRLAVFVHGCFWHGHECPKGRPPASRPNFWIPKLARNVERDAEQRDRLAGLGWRTAVVWECETRKPGTLLAAIQRALVA